MRWSSPTRTQTGPAFGGWRGVMLAQQGVTLTRTAYRAGPVSQVHRLYAIEMY